MVCTYVCSVHSLITIITYLIVKGSNMALSYYNLRFDSDVQVLLSRIVYLPDPHYKERLQVY